MKSIDFDRVARYYDLCVHPDFDLPFWVEEARRHPGRRLELMCGTGRISLAILRAGLPLTCVDYSAGLLSVFREKLSREGLAAELVNMDVRCLDLGPARYDWAFVGFHALAELAGEGDLLRALRRVASCLTDGGVFSCSLHNPVVRARGGHRDGYTALDGRWHDFEPVQLPEPGGRLEWRGRYRYEPDSGTVSGEQVYRELDCAGRAVTQVEQPVRFRLFTAAEIEAAVEQCGFELVSRWGDYDRSPCDPASSPFLIYELRKAAEDDEWQGEARALRGCGTIAGGDPDRSCRAREDVRRRLGSTWSLRETERTTAAREGGRRGYGGAEATDYASK